jgi:membrane protein implicated in regulation of membrane protease activity
MNFDFNITDNMVLFWIIAAIAFAAIEGFTLGLVTIWFTIGAAAATVVALAHGSLPIQVAVFFAVSIVLLIFTRPILVKKLKVGREKNNIELIEGKIGLVTGTIGPFDSGLVKVNGIVWTAVGEDSGFAADEGSEVEVVRVEGVKLIVKKKQ